MIAVQVVQSQLYGCTYELVKHYLQDRLDIQVTFVDSANVDEFKTAIRPNTKVCMTTLSNNRCIYDTCVVPRGGRKVKEKYTDIADRSLTCHTATGPHMPHRITQCYLPPGRGDIPASIPAETGTRLSDPGGKDARLSC